MKNLMSFLFGIVLMIVGAFLFLSNVRVSNFSFFFRFRGTNITAILMLLLCIFLVACIVYPNFVTKLLLAVTFLLFVISIIMSLNFVIMHMSALEIFVILGTFFGGIGLALRGVIGARSEEKDAKDK